jgi:hypothetical protein
MRRVVLVSLFAVALALPAIAGNAHFVSLSVTNNGDNTLTVTGKEAGLGDEQQVHIVVTAIAECINGGSNHPKAVNKTGVSAGGDFPVQNGKADFSLTTDPAVFQPSCDPPMSVDFVQVTVSDVGNGISKTFTGPF